MGNFSLLRMSKMLSGLCTLAALLLLSAAAPACADEKQDMINDALRAAPASIAKDAKVMDWKGNVLREGTNGWICYPTPMGMTNHSPMCFDKQWMTWADAWQNKKPFKATEVGVAYMLAGDSGYSNTDPYATAATPSNQWVQEGPHLMILFPEASSLDAFSTDPNNGGPYVMWKGTPYQHLMVPVGPRSASK